MITGKLRTYVLIGILIVLSAALLMAVQHDSYFTTMGLALVFLIIVNHALLRGRAFALILALIQRFPPLQRSSNQRE